MITPESSDKYMMKLRVTFFLNKVFPTPPRAPIRTRLGARGKPNFCTMTCTSSVRNIRLLTCR